MSLLEIKSKLPSLVLVSLFSLLAACASPSASNSGGDSSSGGDEITKACAGGTTCGPLDEVQVVVGDILVGSIASALPAPLGPVVDCASNAVNNVVDVPDALLVGIEDLATTQDPEALLSAFNDIGSSLGSAVFNLQGLLSSLAGSEATCGETGSDDTTDGGTDEVTEGPTGTPLDLALTPLIDGLNSLTTAVQGSAAGTPAAEVIDPIVSGLDALLIVLNGGSIPELPGLPDGGDNPLTELLTQLQSQLADIAGGSIPSFPGSPDSGTDPDLVPVADVLTSVTDALSLAIGQGRGGVEDAAGSEVPVISGLLLTLETTLTDAGTLLDAVGSYDGVATSAATEGLLENLLGNLLTRVIPLELIGDAAGQDIAGPIRSGIAEGVSALGDGTELAIDPLFSIVLDESLSPVLDPIEGLLAQLLAASPVNLDDMLAGGLDQLVDALTDLSGSNNSLDSLLAGLTAVGGDVPLGDAPSGTPLDLLLGALVENDSTGLLGGLLEQLSSGLGDAVLDLFAQLDALAG